MMKKKPTVRSKRLLSLTQLVKIPCVWDYDVSPDGNTVAFVWDKTGQLELYLASLEAGAQSRRPRRITRGPESKIAPRFSPDGRMLAYGQDYGGDECFDIFVYDLAARTTRNLTPGTPDEIINPEFTWSGESRRLAFVSNRAGTFATYVLEVDRPSAPRRISHYAYSDHGVEWSPDGRWLAVTALTEGQQSWLFIYSPDGGEPIAVVGWPSGTTPMDANYPAWAPGSKRLAFVSNAPGISAIYTCDVHGQSVRQETSAEHEASEPHWSPDGQRLAYTWNVDGNIELAVKHLPTGEISAVSVGAGVHSGPRFADERTLLALYSSAQRPEDLWAITVSELGVGRTRKRQITHSLPGSYRPRQFAQPRVLRWQSDGLSVAGLLYTPRGFRRGRTPGPAVVYVLGGPTYQFKNEWFVLVQHLVSQGCVVLAPNYRGSSGYGLKFQEANGFDLGGGDMRDVIAGAEFLVRAGYAARGRLAITGASYGGYLTMTALTHYPDVFKAGSAVVPFLNRFTEHANEREDLQYWDQENFGDPVKDAERYRAFSPIYYMEDIVAPVQMIAGANDPRCPASETEQAAQALQAMDVPVEVIIYPDEGHSFRKRANRVDANRRRAAFLLRYLGLRPNQPRA